MRTIIIFVNRVHHFWEQYLNVISSYLHAEVQAGLDSCQRWGIASVSDLI